MKNNCQQRRKTNKNKISSVCRKKKLSLKDQLFKASNHIPLKTSFENKIFDKQDSSEFFELFHTNFNVIIPETQSKEENKKGNAEYYLPTHRGPQNTKKKENQSQKGLSKNNSRNKITNKTKSKSKTKSVSMKKNTNIKTAKQVLKKENCYSCKTISKIKSPCTLFEKIMRI